MTRPEGRRRELINGLGSIALQAYESNYRGRVMFRQHFMDQATGKLVPVEIKFDPRDCHDTERALSWLVLTEALGMGPLPNESFNSLCTALRSWVP